MDVKEGKGHSLAIARKERKLERRGKVELCYSLCELSRSRESIRPNKSMLRSVHINKQYVMGMEKSINKN